jgi:hypothetical protein
VVFLICKYLLHQVHGLIPVSITKVKVTVVGGGGNGGTSAARPNNLVVNQTRYSGGGGGGGTAIEVIPFPSGTNVAVTVGGAGGTSSFGAYCSATGGAAGETSSISCAYFCMVVMEDQVQEAL